MNDKGENDCGKDNKGKDEGGKNGRRKNDKGKNGCGDGSDSDGDNELDSAGYDGPCLPSESATAQIPSSVTEAGYGFAFHGHASRGLGCI